MPTYSEVAVLHRDPSVSITVYTCHGSDPPGPSPEEFSAENQVVFVRSGSFLRSSPRGRTLADPNQALFFQKGTTYRVRHPVGGDECVSVSVSDTDRLAWMESWGASTARGVDSPVPWESGLVSSAAARGLYRLAGDRGGGVDGFDWHAQAMDLLAGVRPLARPARARPGPGRRDVDLIEAVRLLLLRRVAEPLRLTDIAVAFGLTPFTLCRMFARVAGLPLHRYRRRLRLRAALDRLAGGARDITALALDLGFSDHSHFTNAFRAEFGVPPSVFRSLRRRPAGGPFPKRQPQ
jgi:AraC family transcriptional regulator